MKVRNLKIGAAVISAAAAAVCATTPLVPGERRIAVVHVHTPIPKTQATGQNALLRGSDQAVPGATIPRPILAHPTATAKPLRPIFPRWFHRRHIAAAPPGIA